MAPRSYFDRITSCESKTAYLTYGAAVASLKRISHKNKRKFRDNTEVRGKVYVYRCKYCPHYHVGHERKHDITGKKNITVRIEGLHE